MNWADMRCSDLGSSVHLTGGDIAQGCRQEALLSHRHHLQRDVVLDGRRGGAWRWQQKR